MFCAHNNLKNACSDCLRGELKFLLFRRQALLRSNTRLKANTIKAEARAADTEKALVTADSFFSLAEHGVSSWGSSSVQRLMQQYLSLRRGE